MQQSYTIYYDGEIADNFNPEEVKKRALIVFKLSEEDIATLFNGTQHILKENLSGSECEQYLNQLLYIGLIAKSDPPLDQALTFQTIDDQPYTDTTINNIKPTKSNTAKLYQKLKFPIITCLSIVIAIIGIYVWQTSTLNTPIAREEEPIVITLKSQYQTQTDHTALALVQQSNVKQCSDPASITLLDQALVQGLTQLAQRSSHGIALTEQTYQDNQELYFDQTRNKRLCKILVKYSTNDSYISTKKEMPYIMYEVIYEIQKEKDTSIRFNIFKEKIISSNLQ